MASDGRERRFEPWPLGLAAALLGMIAVCVAFWIVALRHADTELLRADERPGLRARAARERPMAAVAETGLLLDGLRCGGCVHRVERALAALEGVEEARVNYTTQRARVRFDPARVNAARLASEVAELGYFAAPYDPEALDRPAEREARAALVRVLVAAFLAMNVMLVAAALYIGGYSDLDAVTRRGLRWLAIALSLPAVGWCALPFWRGAWNGLRRREITMDVPIALGVATSFGASVAGTLAESPHLFIDSAAMIVFLILLGRTLERRGSARASRAVDRLAALTPPRALRCGPDGVEEVDAAQLAAGDRVRVPPGQAIPADARVCLGTSEVDESLLTGESLPVLRGVGDAVAGGTLNLLAELECEVVTSVREGTVARLSALLERALSEKPRIQQLADRVAAFFAPTVLALASATALGWIAAGAPALEVALTTAAVLIVACPCALGLATPAAVTAALGRAAALGILIKRADAIEPCARVERVVLDKTGTLSAGRFSVEAVVAAPGSSEERVLAAAASAEGSSTHPIADAIRRRAAERGVLVEAVLPREQRPGLGVEAGAGGTRLRVGSRALLDAGGVAVPAALEARAAELASSGLSLAWVARGRVALGCIAVADPPREDAARAVERLRALGLAVELMSGDHAGAVAFAARRAGIRDTGHGVGPEQKLEQVCALRAAGVRLLFAGDGVNDAAASAAADVGVCMARGADVTLHAADVVIRTPRLGAVPDLVALCRATLARVRENLGFALLYNAVAVPLAMGGWLEPLHAAIAMSLSSLVVTANSLRLLTWRPEP